MLCVAFLRFFVKRLEKKFNVYRKKEEEDKDNRQRNCNGQKLRKGALKFLNEKFERGERGEWPPPPPVLSARARARQHFERVFNETTGATLGETERDTRNVGNNGNWGLLI